MPAVPDSVLGQDAASASTELYNPDAASASTELYDPDAATELYRPHDPGTPSAGAPTEDNR